LLIDSRRPEKKDWGENVSTQKQLLSLKQFQEKTKINYDAVQAFEEMGFVTSYALKNGEWTDHYYSLDDAKIIRIMHELLDRDPRPLNLKQAHRMAVEALNSTS
jgi:hypothetical protein